MRTIENKFIRFLVALIAPIAVIGYCFLMTKYPIIAGATTVILSLIALTYVIYKFLTP